MRKSPHLYIKITMGSKRLLRKQGKARHNVNDPELKVLGSHRKSKRGKQNQACAQQFTAWLHASLQGEAAGRVR